MAEYIEKQHLLDFLDGCIEEEKGNRSQVIVEAIKMTIERMPLGDAVSGQDFRDCCNELCLKCGQYQTKHLGSCNGCRWEKR